MLVLLPVAALLTLFIAFASRGEDWRRAAVLTLLAGGLWVAVVSELAGLFGELNQRSILIAWSVFLLASAAAMKWRTPAWRLPWAGLGLADSVWLLIAAAIFVFSAGAAFLAAVWGAPNGIDAMYYHLPRIVFWLQNGSLEFFPANYYQQISLQPLAELAMLHLFALSGGDHFVQLIQWTGFLGCVAGVSWLAGLLGASKRGQIAAAALAASAPSAALLAAGAKNDLVLAFFLIAATGFAVEAIARRRRRELALTAAAAGLALLTKGTAYVFLPAIALGITAAAPPESKRFLLRWAVPALLLALLLNAPHYTRNYAYSGHPLGDGSANECVETRYANARIDAAVILSNIVRNVVLQFGPYPPLGPFLFEQAEALHDRLGLDVNARATTFYTTQFDPSHSLLHPQNEALASNLLISVLLIPLAIWMIRRRRFDAAAGLSLGLLLGFVLFCAYLKWQPWHARLHTPLQLLACAPLGLMLGGLRGVTLPAALALAAVLLLAPNPLHNEMQPLVGPRNVFDTPRAEQDLLGLPEHRFSSPFAVQLLLESSCRSVSIDAFRHYGQYPLMIALLEADPSFRFRAVGVPFASGKLRPAGWFEDSCALVCLACADQPNTMRQYADEGTPIVFGDLAVFLQPETAPPGMPLGREGVSWLLDRDGDRRFDPATELLLWGPVGAQAVAGDWDGDGDDDLAVFDPISTTWAVDADGDFRPDAAQEAAAWGSPGDLPAPGDWNGDGRLDFGVFGDGRWRLDLNGDGAFDPATEEWRWGSPGDVPVAGDWNGDGRDEIGVFSRGRWYLDLDGDFIFDPETEDRAWGSPDSTPVWGDWNGDGVTDVGAFQQGMWFLDYNGDGEFDREREEFGWGSRESIPVVGDWDGDGADDVAAVEPETMIWYLRTDPAGSSADVPQLVWGEPGSRPIAGDWNGDGTADLGAVTIRSSEEEDLAAGDLEQPPAR